jgi:NADH-quinone oxidoreductase subunit H
MAEYIHTITVAAIAVTLFWGGWQPPFLFLNFIPGVIWFAVKVFVFCFFFIWQRATFPRLRYDQIMKFGWKILLPLTLINLLITALIVSLKG